MEALLTKTSAVAEATRVLRDDRMTEELLERAKTLYHRSKREYAGLRPALEAQTAGPLSALFFERTLDGEFNAIGTDLLLVIGLLLTSSRAREAAVGLP
ncbi:hypothetical protein [Streptomyces sp. NPDC001530]|uniref:hypothetical protein n=1 Tax=Streptomyces sp. NPDC001530 TaxID=3364582 RepID=UPI00367D31C0